MALSLLLSPKYFAEVVKRLMKEITGWDSAWDGCCRRKVYYSTWSNFTTWKWLKEKLLEEPFNVWRGRWSADSVCTEGSRRKERDLVKIKGCQRRRCDGALQKHWVIPSFSFALQEVNVATAQSSLCKCSCDMFQMCCKKLATGVMQYNAAPWAC